MTNKEEFAHLAALARLSNADLAPRFGKSERVVEAWRRPSHPLCPPDDAVRLMEAIYIDTLRSDARAAGYDLTPRKAA